MRRLTPLVLLICGLASPALLSQPEDPSPTLPSGAYLSMNPLALSAFIPSTFTREVLPYASNLESGLSLAGGYFFEGSQLEGRVVLGSPSALIFNPQLHAGFRYFPFTGSGNRVIPLGIGLFLRGWDTYYTHSGIHFFNLSPHLNIGYVLRMQKIFLDLRIGWDAAILTWSNLEYSSPRATFSAFPPTFSMNIGFDF
jgi:hypothetical protein